MANLTENRGKSLFYIIVIVFFVSLYFLLNSSLVAAVNLCPACTTDSCDKSRIGPKFITEYKACSGTFSEGFTCGNVAATALRCSVACGNLCDSNSQCASKEECIDTDNDGFRESRQTFICTTNLCECTKSNFIRNDPRCARPIVDVVETCNNNNIIEGNEQCDGVVPEGKTCASGGNYAGGTLSCSNCILDWTQCVARPPPGQ